MPIAARQKAERGCLSAAKSKVSRLANGVERGECLCPYGQKTPIRCFSRIILNASGTLNPSVLLNQPIEPQTFNNFKYLIFDIFGALLRNSQTPAVSPTKSSPLLTETSLVLCSIKFCNSHDAFSLAFASLKPFIFEAQQSPTDKKY
jgi:hypothetical protein